MSFNIYWKWNIQWIVICLFVCCQNLKHQYQHQICRSFSIFELYSTHCSHHGSFCPSLNSHLTFLQAQCFTCIQYCWPYITLVNSPFQQLSALPKLNPSTSVLAVTAASHPTPALTQSPRYVNSLTFSTSSHSFSSCSTVDTKLS